MKIRVYSNNNIKGSVKISGSKNAALPIICASLLNRNKVVLNNVPRISDVFDIITILKYLNCKINFKRNKLMIDSSTLIFRHSSTFFTIIANIVQKVNPIFIFLKNILHE